MSPDHGSPEQQDMFGYVAPKKGVETPKVEATPPPDSRQIEMSMEKPAAEKSVAERIKQIQDLLTTEKTALSLRTTQKRAEDQGEYYQGYGMPSDEARTDGRLTLTDKEEDGPSLLILHPKTTPTTKEKRPAKSRRSQTTHSKPQPVDWAKPQTNELYFCPNGINGNNEGIKIAKGVTVAQFMKQWND